MSGDGDGDGRRPPTRAGRMARRFDAEEGEGRRRLVRLIRVATWVIFAVAMAWITLGERAASLFWRGLAATGDPVFRSDAREGLAAIDDPKGVPLYVEAMRDGDAAGERYLELVARHAGAGDVGAIAAVAREADPARRLAALRVLLRLKDAARGRREAFDAAVDAIEAPPTSSVAYLVVRAIGTGDLAPGLLDRLGRDDPVARRAAFHALHALNDLPSVRDSSAVRAACVAALGDGDAKVRRYAALNLFARREVEAVDAFERAAGDADATIRTLAAESLSRARDPRRASALRGLANDENLRVRAEAVIGLIAIADAEAPSRLSALLVEKDAPRRVEAVESLADATGLDPDAVAGALAAAIAADPIELRVAIANRLGATPSDVATGALVAALEDREPAVRTAAADALGRRRARIAAPPLAAALRRAQGLPEVLAIHAALRAATGAEIDLPEAPPEMLPARAADAWQAHLRR